MTGLKHIRILFFIGICFSCTKNDELNQEEEAHNLNEMYSEIENMSLSISCIDSLEWKFTAFGSKPCGGPSGYIAYSEKVNVDVFMKRIKAYTKAQQEFNEKWEIISDCSIIPQPTGVTCQDGKPLLVY